MAKQSIVRIDIEEHIANNYCLCDSHKHFGAIVPDGWSDTDSSFDKENDYHIDKEAKSSKKKQNTNWNVETINLKSSDQQPPTYYPPMGWPIS